MREKNPALHLVMVKKYSHDHSECKNLYSPTKENSKQNKNKHVPVILSMVLITLATVNNSTAAVHRSCCAAIEKKMAYGHHITPNEAFLSGLVPMNYVQNNVRTVSISKNKLKMKQPRRKI